MRVTVFFTFCLLSSLVFAQRELTTIELNYASPEQIVAAIRPLLSADSSVSVYQNRLIMNVTAEELTKTQALLQQLDIAGRQLLVSLRSDSSGADSRNRVEVDGVIQSGNTVITTRKGNRSTETQTTVRVTDSHGTSTGNGNQAVRATEGRPAYIATGMTAPVQSYSVGTDGRRYYSQDYVEAVAGFYATTWVNDGVVRVSIDQSNNALEGQTINTQQLRSEVSGALGQWLPIGTIDTASRQSDQGIGSRGLVNRTNSTQLFLKIELLE
jgi:hypothetical protein